MTDNNNINFDDFLYGSSSTDNKDETLSNNIQNERELEKQSSKDFVKETTGARISYPTRWITPYASWVRYKYAGKRDFAVAVSGGLALHFWDMDFRGGVEIFEPKREETRKTYFSMSVEAKF